MNQQIKSPTGESGASIKTIKSKLNRFSNYSTLLNQTKQDFQSDKSSCSKDVKADITKVLTRCYTFFNNYLSTDKQSFNPVLKKHLTWFKCLTEFINPSKLVGNITNSGINRTRQIAVFLYLKFKPVYGGLREGNITPKGNTLRRLFAVFETCHPINTGGLKIIK